MSAEAEWDEDGAHIHRVGAFAGRLAAELDLDQTACRHVELAARLHDIGMKAVPRTLKLKTTHLSTEEQREVERHTVDGAELVALSNIAYVKEAEQIIRHHHERWDGSAYPDGLRHNSIPLAARIVAIADAFDSMTHKRCFRGVRSIDETLNEIKRQSGRQFDPELVPPFIELIETLRNTQPILMRPLRKGLQPRR